MLLLISLLFMGAASAFAADVDFHVRPRLAGKALLTEPGFAVTRELGVANVAPEMRMPVELVYKSANEKSGAFGFAWRCPQLESAVKWSKGALLWTTPWGEELRFYPKKAKTPKDAIALEPIEAAKRGSGLFSPYADWETDAGSSDFAKRRRFAILGKNDLKGWRFDYLDGGLASVTTPHGATAEFVRDARGRLVAVASRGVRFVELERNADGLVAELRLNGVPTAFAYAQEDRAILPKTADGLPKTVRVAALKSVKTAALDAETFAYESGCLASAKRGRWSEAFKAADGRLLSDGDYAYSYPSKTSVSLRNALGETATHDYDPDVGVYRVRDFAGRETKTYFFMRIDAAYYGKIRLVENVREKQDLVSFRYDRKTGRPTTVTDRLGNSRHLEYDADGNCVRLLRRAAWSFGREPVRAFAYDRRNRLVAVSELDEKGNAVRTTTLVYDGSGRPSRIADGCRTLTVAYSASGFPTEAKDDFGSVAFAYDRYNRLVSTTDADGVVTVRSYADHGGVAKVERRNGKDVLSSIAIDYDGSGRPASMTDPNGLARSCERDAKGRIAKESFPDGSEVAYSYDALGRLSQVVDENGHEIRFGWDSFGLATRLTAAGQLTKTTRDARGRAVGTSASKDGRTARAIRREYDDCGRLVKVAYAKDEVETFSYDVWGRLASHTRGKSRETYLHDHFGRLVEKDENGTVFTYAYDAWGRRTSRTIRFADGGEALEEVRSYDKFGRLAEIRSFGSSVTYRYDARGRVSRQTVDGTPIDFVYTKRGRLAGKYFGGRQNPVASLEYEYAKDGKIVARTANGVRQAYEYDRRGQLVAVKENGADVERYAYDRAGNMVRKTVRGKTTTFAFDGANQLVSSTADGVTTRYEYDAIGRLVREGSKIYRYGYLDKVLSMTDGATTFTYGYHVDGQLASADYGGGRSERFTWDGLALVRRGDATLINEPHVGGGSPVVSSLGAAYFNDILGTTVGARRRSRYAANSPTAFGEGGSRHAFFTGKPQVDGLGHAFLFRNYRASLGKWQTADPVGYPDGWNRLLYGFNSPSLGVDLWGAYWHYFSLSFMKSCNDMVYILGPGLPLDADVANCVRISESLFKVLAQLLADNIQGDIMKVGLADLYGLYSNADHNGLGANPLEPSETECLAKARDVMSRFDYRDLSIVSKELLSISYDADSIVSNLIQVDRMSATWLVHFKCWIEVLE